MPQPPIANGFQKSLAGITGYQLKLNGSMPAEPEQKLLISSMEIRNGFPGKNPKGFGLKRRNLIVLNLILSVLKICRVM